MVACSGMTYIKIGCISVNCSTSYYCYIYRQSNRPDRKAQLYSLRKERNKFWEPEIQKLWAILSVLGVKLR